MSYDIVTYDVAQFGVRELEELELLMREYRKHRSNFKYFSDSNVKPGFNMHSLYVFLTNDDCQTLMLNDEGEIEEFLNCGECGFEGFLSEFSSKKDSDSYHCPKCSVKLD